MKLSYLLFQNSVLFLLLLYSLLAFLGLLFIFTKLSFPKQEVKKKTSALSFVCPSRAQMTYTKKDYFFLALLTILYAIFSLHRLGSTTFPTTTWQPVKEKQEIILQLNENTHYDAIYALYGEGDNNNNLTNYQLGFEGIQLLGSYDLASWSPITTLGDTRIYQYEIHSGNWDYPYIKVLCEDKNSTLTEIGFKETMEERFLPISIHTDEANSFQYPASLLIDEQEKLVTTPTYYDEGYFDEVYHPRNAWEIANGQHMYYSVHPLLGTSIMALFIKLFGLSPFVWRFPGALFGILLVPLFYAVLRTLFQSTNWAAIGTTLFCVDFMHLTTSRIGTLEPFSIFFILLSYYFMIRYFYLNFFDASKQEQYTYLGLSGLTMGLSIATKWTGCYAAIGLAIILFTNWTKRYMEYRKAKAYLATESEEALAQKEAQHIVSSFPNTLITSILFCIGAFIVLPIVIYFVSYIPCKIWRDGYSLKHVLEQIEYIYSYHANLTATHPFQSTWKDWLLDLKPILYYTGTDQNGYYHTISCMSNPILSWAGLLTILYTIYAFLRNRNKEAFLILVGYIVNLAPWMLVDRCVFAYHFYPTSLYMILSIVFCLRACVQKNPKSKIFVLGFVALSVLFFLVFLPVFSGLGTSKTYVQLLRWFSTWYF
ncbi:MAG: glycosyltransferase family 39 protein [Solobacterium sp.]|nr:glycosyltransferase family 39 protein [Solobacterium sp.]